MNIHPHRLREARVTLNRVIGLMCAVFAGAFGMYGLNRPQVEAAPVIIGGVILLIGVIINSWDRKR